MIDIAIIDDGIDPEIMTKNNIVKSINFCSDNELIPTSIISHGTICAQILNQCLYNYNLNNTRIHSYKVMNPGKYGNVKDLCSAIDHCVKENIKVINLSIGSAEKYDYDILYDHVQNAIKNKIILICAHSNQDELSYPANFDGVVSVRHVPTRKGKLSILPTSKNKLCIGTSGRHIINVNNKVRLTPAQNSFAAPVVSAYVSKFILHQNNDIMNTYDLLENLKNDILSSVEYGY